MHWHEPPQFAVAELPPLQVAVHASALQLRLVVASQALPPLHSRSHVPLPQLMTVSAQPELAVQLTSQP